MFRILENANPYDISDSSDKIPEISWLTNSISKESSALRLFSFATFDWIEAIHFCIIDSKAPPSGRVFVAICCINSLYVDNPCPFVPVNLLSGDKSASITTNDRSIALFRIICNKKLFPLPYFPHTKQKEETPKAEENTAETEKKDEKTEQTKTTETKTEEKKEETKKTVETTKYVSAETLNMREKAENTANIVSQLKINAKVTVLETTGTWSKIKVNGKTGYVASKYLSDKKVEVTSRSEDLTRTGEQTKNTAKASSESEKNNTEKTTTSNSGTTSGNSVVSYAKQYLGCKYVSGGSSPTTGFDCSGFTSYVYKHFGISISRSSGAQASNGTAVSKSNLQAGDLVIFNNRSNTAIGHVGIYIGGNTFIHAGNSSTGVITTSLSDSYYSARYVTGRRIIN